MRVLVVDDDRLVCMSLKTILESDPQIEVIGIGHSGLDALALYPLHKPDVLLMDIRMDAMSGIEAAEILLQQAPDAKILLLTTFSDDDYIVKALRIGVKGYILKQHFDCIIPAIKTVYMGQQVFGDEIITKIPTLLSDSGKMSFVRYDLNEKESQIISQVAEGLSNKEISEVLFLSEGTIRNYVSTILEKLNLRDRTQLAIFYYKNK